MAAVNEPDQIELRGLRLVGVCGVLPEEQARPQPLEVDLDVEVNMVEAGRTDDLEATVDYGGLCDVVADVVEQGTPRLLERLAAVIAEAVLSHDRRIGTVTVSVRKLRPPVAHALDTSGVRITRHR